MLLIQEKDKVEVAIHLLELLRLSWMLRLLLQLPIVTQLCLRHLPLINTLSIMSITRVLILDEHHQMRSVPSQDPFQFLLRLRNCQEIMLPTQVLMTRRKDDRQMLDWVSLPLKIPVLGEHLHPQRERHLQLLSLQLYWINNCINNSKKITTTGFNLIL